MYDEAFLLAHDCSANTSHTDNPSNYEMTIRVIRDVPKGDAITLSYAYTLQVYLSCSKYLEVKPFLLIFSVSLQQGTLKRREHLQEGKFFWCQCKRCSDPTGKFCRQVSMTRYYYTVRSRRARNIFQRNSMSEMPRWPNIFHRSARSGCTVEVSSLCIHCHR